LSKRDLWVRNHQGQEIVVGDVEFIPRPAEGVRVIRTRPAPGTRSNHSSFGWLIGELHKLGYTPLMKPDGSIEIDLPLQDHYGGLLSRIAWTYRKAQGGHQ
jgi:hypothetical protein